MLLLVFCLFVCLIALIWGVSVRQKKNGHLVNLAVHLNLFVWKLNF